VPRPRGTIDSEAMANAVMGRKEPIRAAMRFRIDVNTLDGKLSYERDKSADALDVAEGGKDSLGVAITDTEEGRTYSVEEFRKRFGH
jgi:hypothetical protein